MKQLLTLLFISLFFLADAQTVNPDYIDGSCYIKLRDTCSLELAPYNYSNVQMNLVFAQYGVLIPGIKKPFPDPTISASLTKIYRIHCTDSAHIDSLVAKLARIPIVEYVEKDPLIKLDYTPNDVHANQWYLAKISAMKAWDITKGSATVVIAIVDNGVRTTHADLAANIWTNTGEIPNNLLDDDLNGYADDVHGYDVADDDANPNPPPFTTNTSPFVHGTHCAGLASAVTDNSKGIASIGFKTKIMPVKCSRDKDSGNTLLNPYDGVYYAMRAHADIISMSWGGAQNFATGQSLITAANSMGILLVAAAGNENGTNTGYPASYPNVLVVGSTDINDKKSSFSNYGSSVDVMAPGSGIYSTFAGDDNAYGYLSGTSMATPIVAGLAALVKAIHPAFTPAQIENAIKAGCDNIDAGNPGFAGQLGAGRINAYRPSYPMPA
jgi:serine protease